MRTTRESWPRTEALKKTPQLTKVHTPTQNGTLLGARSTSATATLRVENYRRLTRQRWPVTPYGLGAQARRFATVIPWRRSSSEAMPSTSPTRATNRLRLSTFSGDPQVSRARSRARLARGENGLNGLGFLFKGPTSADLTQKWTSERIRSTSAPKSIRACNATQRGSLRSPNKRCSVLT
jgi:hypothetical protein